MLSSLNICSFHCHRGPVLVSWKHENILIICKLFQGQQFLWWDVSRWHLHTVNCTDDIHASIGCHVVIHTRSIDCSFHKSDEVICWNMSWLLVQNVTGTGLTPRSPEAARMTGSRHVPHAGTPENPVPLDQQKGVVYSIPCNGCPKVYIGQTSWTLRHRLAEHQWVYKALLK